MALPWRPWSTRERLESTGRTAIALDDVVVLIPARDEAQVLGQCLDSLRQQGDGLKVVVVDDESADGTAAVACDAGLPGMVVVQGLPAPAGWSGKLWALEQARVHVDRPLTMLLDADMALAPGLVPALRARMHRRGVVLVSLMAELPMARFWERLLLPAFVYFFKLLYPFRLSNSDFPGVAAAAGGCILMETRVLDELGGFSSLRGALIDDCTLARRVKGLGYRIWTGLTRSVKGTRGYAGLWPIWHMVERTAFTQLRYSIGWLMICSLLMVAAFITPMMGILLGPLDARLVAGAALAALVGSYVPTLRFYGITPAWGLAMPFVGTLFLCMTWSSAIRYWAGTRSRWRGRVYSRARDAREVEDSDCAVNP
jgi:hopene-associated glycosyltransferase HpnB